MRRAVHVYHRRVQTQWQRLHRRSIRSLLLLMLLLLMMWMPLQLWSLPWPEFLPEIVLATEGRRTELTGTGTVAYPWLDPVAYSQWLQFR